MLRLPGGPEGGGGGNQSCLEFGTTPDQDQAILLKRTEQSLVYFDHSICGSLPSERTKSETSYRPHTTPDREQTVDIRVDLHPIKVSDRRGCERVQKRSRRNQAALLGK
jgi:hypothetical protein